MTTENIDQAEIEKFEKLARSWWDLESEFKPLHDINPLRLDYISQRTQLAGKEVLDIGCGGGILTESLARSGAITTGIDMGEAPLQVARLHQHESGLEIDYQQITAEALALQCPGKFDVITCLEMLEHVPDPASVISACRQLLKPNGHLFLSTINRNPKAYLFAILGGEYLLKLLPAGTHDYQKFIKPSELAKAIRAENLCLKDITGMTYNPLTKVYRLGPDTDVNYLLHAVYE
ncbi:MAG: bifunctional 2-polyprenyl-6-hydroxyphenol methylase/3-demethylubiquinol 3-O-methyltransferase UbiG [Gammaproteobacteria bacterium]|jgi:2-polyprenyl-6-hydroxyphenyl methylase / 3-demethylubiquinone-9 3-methyltransferase|nr:bifunctional 2-polyprenyl-6-hydroxyphenol methylase/3-demethylubiquinol 3-O-methyltransferase UbiG [Gammaproteobacteria bacterium]MBT5203922.1 bifunctional 2-polyprenyl-6-hydroxyphenol methylase/3-demethylubiquinol 3-O-methyltransferase UbiG [Gammaproteobacteria bacterium]MBT5602147.1 bifunctional 2-polyprenyl-6-hydroxyphenol methylase/3-demethylubiquinol 3-O-methyltransferase UbiG [Gammaproteobacteria bacterium]MBT6243931.1 bifunctional 2-polyprenyl-6-hydroxyphenol methylase/3-demethylubiqui